MRPLRPLLPRSQFSPRDPLGRERDLERLLSKPRFPLERSCSRCCCVACRLRWCCRRGGDLLCSIPSPSSPLSVVTVSAALLPISPSSWPVPLSKAFWPRVVVGTAVRFSAAVSASPVWSQYHRLSFLQLWFHGPLSPVHPADSRSMAATCLPQGHLAL